jgi:ketosteroid isomerase-like protein
MKMRSKYLLSLCILLISISLFALVDDKDENEITQLFQKRIDAIHNRDVVLIEQIYAHDPNTLYFREQKIYKGWNTYHEYWQAGLKELTPHIKLSFKNLEIHLSNKSAWCTVTYHIEIKEEEGKLSKTWGYMTVILEKRDSRWQIIHENIGPAIEETSTESK